MPENNSVTFFILAGRKKTRCSPAVWVADARERMVFDLIQKIRPIRCISRIVVSSNNLQFLEKTASLDGRVIPDVMGESRDFSFGVWLQERVRRYRPEKLFYWGAGASPFVTGEIIEGICASLLDGNDVLYTNNFFSSDWVAFTPAGAVLEMEPPPLDNNLAYSLWQQKSLRSIYVAPAFEICGDLDTPADLLVLAEHPSTGPAVGEYIASLGLDTSRVKAMAGLLKGRNRIFLAGRVGSSLFSYLDGNCPCSFRIISEERGMRSFGRMERREVKSILGLLLEQGGIENFFAFLEAAADGAFIDTRVCFAHVRGSVSTCDRFYSDLLMHEKIKDPFARELTRAAGRSRIPVLMGGHSLISGGLWAMVQAYARMPSFY